jgi:septal ring factor EnvC (AmiA/AmiB activator)
MYFDMGDVFTAIGLAVSAIGGIIARDRAMQKTIKDGEEKLHRRIDVMNSTFVRRDDLATQLARLSNDVHEIKEDIRETNRRLDAFLHNK